MAEKNHDQTAAPDTEGIRFVHRLVHLRYDIPLNLVLNTHPAPAEPKDTKSLAAELLRMMRGMRAEAFGENGRHVNYARLKESQIFFEYRECTSLLRNFDPALLESREERLAFWINLYNALVLDAIIEFGVKRSVTEIPGIFWRAAYNVGGLRYSSFDIEYGILRANGAHPAIPGPHFGAQDPRRRYSLRSLDPRVHFALVCAARSCPPIAAYHPEGIDAQLDLATRSFVNNGGVEIDPSRNRVYLSKIFQWYAPDFGGSWLGFGDKQPLLTYVLPYLEDKAAKTYLRENKPQVQFQDYDWRLNLSPA